MSKVIKVSDGIYKQLSELSKGMEMPISELATKLIENSLKGYPMPQSVTGFDYEKYSRLQDRDLRRKNKLEAECKEIEDFVSGITDSVTRRIFRIYYIDGRKNVTQRDVAKKIHLDRSRVSRKIDDFLKNAQKAQNAHL